MSAKVSVLGSVSFGWLHAHGGFRYDEPYFLDSRHRLAQDEAINAFLADRFPDEPIYNFEAHCVRPEGRRRPVALVGGIQTNLIIGAGLGARFVFQTDKDPDITPTPLADVRSLGRLWDIDWASTWPVSLFLDQIGEMRQFLSDRYAIVPPFFWDTSGWAVTFGPVTTAQKLMGERVFTEMIDDAAFLREFLEWIMAVKHRLIHLFAEAAGLTVKGIHLGVCSACMVGPQQFEAFILPAIQTFSREFGAVKVHSCGLSDHLADLFARIENLECLNVGSYTSVRTIRERVGDVRVDVIPDARLVTFGTPEEIDRWVRDTVEENGDGRLEFQYHMDLLQPTENCLQINRTLRELGFECRREGLY